MPDSAHDDVTRERWTPAILALLGGKTLEEAAEAAGVARRTLYDWRKTPAFQAAFKREAAEIAKEARAKLSGSTTLAVDALTAILQRKAKGGNVEDRDVIAAARALLGFAIGERHVFEEDVSADVRGTFGDLEGDELRALVSALRERRGGAPLEVSLPDDD